MACGLADIVTRRRAIDDSVAADEFKRVSIGRLDALLELVRSNGA